MVSGGECTRIEPHRIMHSPRIRIHPPPNSSGSALHKQSRAPAERERIASDDTNEVEVQRTHRPTRSKNAAKMEANRERDKNAFRFYFLSDKLAIIISVFVHAVWAPRFCRQCEFTAICCRYRIALLSLYCRFASFFAPRLPVHAYLYALLAAMTTAVRYFFFRFHMGVTSVVS